MLKDADGCVMLVSVADAGCLKNLLWVKNVPVNYGMRIAAVDSGSRSKWQHESDVGRYC